MINPFIKLIGLRGLSGVPYDTNTRYLNDLPGISTELVASLEQSDTEQVKDVWNRVHSAALDRIQAEIEAVLAVDNTYTATLARIKEPQPLDGVLELYEGYEGVFLSTPPVMNSRLVIHELVFLSMIETSVQADVVILDQTRNRELWRKNHLILPGPNRLPVGFTREILMLDSPRLFVGIQNNNLQLVRLVNPVWTQTGTLYDLTRPARLIPEGVAIRAQGYVHVEAEHRRSLTHVLQRFTNDLQFAYLNLCAHLLLMEKLASVNFNLFTQTNRLLTQEMAENYGKEFVRQLKPQVRLIRDYLGKGGNLKADPEDNEGYYVDSLV